MLKLDAVMYKHLKIVETDNRELKRIVLNQHETLVSLSIGDLLSRSLSIRNTADKVFTIADWPTATRESDSGRASESGKHLSNPFRIILFLDTSHRDAKTSVQARYLESMEDANRMKLRHAQSTRTSNPKWR